MSFAVRVYEKMKYSLNSYCTRTRYVASAEALARANQSAGFLPSMVPPAGPGDMPRNASSTDMSEVSSHKVLITWVI